MELKSKIIRSIYPGLLALLLLNIANMAQAQIGGQRSFAFVHIEPTARLAALGGSGLTLYDQDITSSFVNPSMHNESMHNRASLGYTNYLADINNAYAGYAIHFDSVGTFSGHIVFMDYGKFDETDETGKVTGQFYANDYIFQIGYGRKFRDDPRFTYGISFKFLYSAYEAYVATAGAFDGALSYVNEERKMAVTAMFRNLGYNFIPFDETREKLPFDIRVGYAKKLEHNPLRFCVVAHNLQRPDISYVNVNKRNKEIDLQTGQVKNEQIGFGEKVMRHFNFGGELVFSENLQLRLGYNYQRRAELGPETVKGATGFSWGVGFGIKKLKVDYAMVTYFPGISTQYFTVSRNIRDFRRARPENF
ncbi:MAG: type IX secretion system protein PorQ [Flavobacteriales bacterium]|nr:type IX secretion system protein PorQ [Flavobacteriales bacterium]